MKTLKQSIHCCFIFTKLTLECDRLKATEQNVSFLNVRTSKLCCFPCSFSPGLSQIDSSHQRPQARLRAFSVASWLEFKRGSKQRSPHQVATVAKATAVKHGRGKNMKKIYIGKTALKSQRNGCKHQKRR